LWATLALIVWLQAALLFNQKRLFNKRVSGFWTARQRNRGGKNRMIAR